MATDRPIGQGPHRQTVVDLAQNHPQEITVRLTIVGQHIEHRGAPGDDAV